MVDEIQNLTNLSLRSRNIDLFAPHQKRSRRGAKQTTTAADLAKWLLLDDWMIHLAFQCRKLKGEETSVCRVLAVYMSMVIMKEIHFVSFSVLIVAVVVVHSVLWKPKITGNILAGGRMQCIRIRPPKDHWFRFL